ncbi:MAG: N-acetylmuramoyl-L-alanine amidase [Ichthyobacteriaceae bacterium]|nr:N-acetylmuramoyl-L-alanine amidase [Ichthyobacteriaceae bacterium]
MKKIYSFILAALLLPVLSFGQVYTEKLDASTFNGKRFCLDPGHGGHDSDDRENPIKFGIVYWESDGVFAQAHITSDILEELGAEVKVTRHTNDTHSEFRQPSLSERVAISNAFDADFFQSVHTNASKVVSGVAIQNRCGMYYRAVGSTTVAESSEGKRMCDVMKDETFDVVYASDTGSKADKVSAGIHFGVLRGHNAPAMLSEASMHNFSREGRRLNTETYQKALSWSYVRSYLKFYDAGELPFGEISGRVLFIKGDETGIAGDNDYKEGNEVNNAKVTLLKNGEVVAVQYTDKGYNGYFMFDRIIAGNYTVKVEKDDLPVVEQEYVAVNNTIIRNDIVLNQPNNKVVLENALMGRVTSSTDDGDGVKVYWRKGESDNVNGYNLYWSDNKQDWNLAVGNDVLKSTDYAFNIESISDFVVKPTSTPVYYKIASVGSDNSEKFSKVYVYRKKLEGKKVLLVDGYEGKSGIKDVDESVSEKYYDALIQNSEIGTIHTAKSDYATYSLMGKYDIVVWILANQSTEDDNFSNKEFANVMGYLKGGGQFIVSGSEIGYDLQMNGMRWTEQEFYTYYLKAKCFADDSGTNGTANGVAGTAFEGLNLKYDVSKPEFRTDLIKPFGEEMLYLESEYGEKPTFVEESFAQSILKDENGNSAAIAYSGGFLLNSTFTGDYTESLVLSKLIYFAFPLELLPSEELNMVFNKSIDYFNAESPLPKPLVPEAPKMYFARGNANDDGVELEWGKSKYAYTSGYDVFYQEVGSTDWKQVEEYTELADAKINIKYADFIDVPVNTSLLKYKVRGVVFENNYLVNGNMSKTLSVYSKSEGTFKVLVVDGFDRVGKGNENVDVNLVNLDVSALSEVAKVSSVSSCDNYSISTGKVKMNDYNAVFWILGEESTVDETFSTSEQMRVKGFLKNGGALFVSGSEIGWDLDRKGTSSDKSFIKDYLKCTYKDDGSSSRLTVTGNANELYSGLDFDFSKLWKINSADAITPAKNATAVFTYNGGRTGGVSYVGTFGKSDKIGAVVTLTFPIETADKKDIVEVFKKTINYFTSQNLSVEDGQVLQSTLAYPNPFTNSISVSVMLDKKTDIKLSVYNFMGQVIKSNVYENIEGNYTLKINTNLIPTGVYMVVMEDEKGNKKVFEVVKK